MADRVYTDAEALDLLARSIVDDRADPEAPTHPFMELVIEVVEMTGRQILRTAEVVVPDFPPEEPAG